MAGPGVRMESGSKRCLPLGSRRFYGQMLLDRDSPGDREQAMELLGEASAGFEELGMSRHPDLAAASRPLR